MSRFLDKKHEALKPYTPGEQPQNVNLIKLNTNENPFPPGPKVIGALSDAESSKLNLYPDPEVGVLIKAASEYYGVPEGMIVAGNGSDELLAFSFMAFSGGGSVYFPDISYGFYRVYAEVFGASARLIALDDNLMINIEDYYNADGMIVIANPNAQTGTAVTRREIERVLKNNENNLVLIDEAYVDFGAESSLRLIDEYDNLLVIQTLSKARNLAGARVGMAFGSEEIIRDINRIKYSFNPYNLNRLSILAGAAAIRDREYFDGCIGKIKDTRKKFVEDMEGLGFSIVPSLANFVLAHHDKISGEEYYRALRSRNILVRHFSDERIKDYVRVTIGREDEMEALISATKELLGKGGIIHEKV